MSGTEEACVNKELGAENTGDNISEINEVEEKIIKQIEYYFGDFNLKRDKFMKEQIKLDDGWIPLETMIKFNRLKAISTDFNQIIAAVKKSSNNLVEVNEDSTKVRRNPEKPITENGSYEDDKLKERCVYVKKFSDSVTLDELQEFFKKFGMVENIQMRRFMQTKQFRGSVFVTFTTKDDAEKFMNLTSVKYGDNALSRETRSEYEKRKNQEFAKKKEQKEKRKEKQAMEKEMEEEKEITEGCLLKLEGVTDKLNWSKIKGFFCPFSSLAFVDIKEGTTEAILRFSNEGDAKVALEKAMEQREDKKLVIEDVELSGSVLEGEEEKNYWKCLRTFISTLYNKKNKKGKKNRCAKKNRNSKDENNSHKHKLDDDDDEEKEDDEKSSPKKLKTEG